jgi:hypothetical protein
VSDGLSVVPHFVILLRLFTVGWSGSLLWFWTEFIVSGPIILQNIAPAEPIMDIVLLLTE